MRAMILAAGKSERLKGFSNGLPKVMLKVQGRAILEHNLRYLARSGVREVIINIHYRPKVIEDFVRKHKGFGLKVKFSREKKLLGTAGGVKKASRMLGKAPFFVLYGDNLMDFDLGAMRAFHSRRKSALTLAAYQPSKTDWSGVAAGLIRIGKKGNILGFEECRGNRKVANDLCVNAGLMLVSPTLLKEIPKGRSYDFSRDLFPKLILQKQRFLGFLGARYVLASDTVVAWKKTNRLARKWMKEI